uniref:SUMO-activating enzyme subunit aos-1 n=2 Tax=Caenorhabditis elegans TaxID=6239 RepID=SAE1_CAEEL|nr:RecName: Full=SUMO-activating enzyme subunit aos-1 [Caenorhabditis elegans]
MEVSKAEQAIYDRQIRLWGMEAQNKIRNSKVLIIGGKQLGAEVAKTLSLAGVDEMHLVDHRLVDTEEIGMNFLYDASVDNSKMTKWAASYNFLYNLNRNVKLFIVEEDVLSKNDSEIEEYLTKFTLVVVLDESYERTAKVNNICRKHHIRFISGAIYGWIGYAFFDFDGHAYLVKAKSPDCLNEEESETGKTSTVVTVDEEFVLETFSYPSFVETLNSDFTAKKIVRKCKRIVPTSYFLVKSMLRASSENKLTGVTENDIEKLIPIWNEEVAAGNHTIDMQPVQPDRFDHLFGPNFGPTAACVGGVIGQEAIKSISEGKNPLRNLFIYTGFESTGFMCNFPPV